MSLHRRQFLRSMAMGTALTAIPSHSWSANPLRASSSPQPSATKTEDIKALAFDAYGTLFDVHSVIALAEQLFPGHGQDLSQTWRSKQLEYTWLRTLMARYENFEKVTEDGLNFACAKLKLDCPAEKRAQLMEAYNHLEAFPEVKDALRRLSALPLAILSNGTPRMLQAVVKSSGLEGVFQQIISVDEIKTFKPSPAVYNLAVNKLKINKPANIGFVSSNAWDVIGGASFGFTSFWINRSNAPGEELGIRPTATLNKLSDLVPLLKPGAATGS